MAIDFKKRALIIKTSAMMEELHMAQGACENQMNLEKEAGTFVHQDEPEMED